MARKMTFLRSAALLASIASTINMAPSAAAESRYVNDLVWFRAGEGFSEVSEYSSTLISAYGAPGDLPVMSSAVAALPATGVWRPSDRRFRFDIDGDGVTDVAVPFGTTGDIPVAGRLVPVPNLLTFGMPIPRWLDLEYNVGAVGVFRPSDGRWRFDVDRDGRSDRMIQFGAAGDIVVFADLTGDYLGDLITWRPSDGRWRIDTNRDGKTDRSFRFGQAGDVVVTGSGTLLDPSVIGLYRPSDQTLRVDVDANGTTDALHHLSDYQAGELVSGATLVGFGAYPSW